MKRHFHTDITRAKKVLVLAETKKAIGYAVINNVVVDRDACLKERSRERISESSLFAALEK